MKRNTEEKQETAQQTGSKTSQQPGSQTGSKSPDASHYILIGVATSLIVKLIMMLV